MKRKYLLLLILQSLAMCVCAQEFWSGTKDVTSAISRTGATKLGALNFRTSGAGTTTVIEHIPTTGDLYIRSVISATNGDVGNLILNDAGGNIGIGTAAPRAQLHIAQASVSNTPRAPIVLSRYWLNDSDTRASAIFHYSDGTSEKLAFAVAGLGGTYTNPVNLNQAKMIIQANGNVGIGITTPKQKLAVNGTVQAKEVKVTTAAADWPDYVFDSSYRLAPLGEVSGRIKKEGHLPDMPSAKALQKDGIEVGSLLKLQQKKIEELTLYLLEQEKKIQAQQEEIKLLKAQKADLEQIQLRLQRLEALKNDDDTTGKNKAL